MGATHDMESFAPLFEKDAYSETDQWHLAPFFTNLDRSVYVPLIFSPELIGALCSRASRAVTDLRHIFLHEFVYPFVNPARGEKDTDETFAEKVSYGAAIRELIAFLHEHSVLDLYSNPRARSFYIKWLAQYGDDSIAQMAGSHIVFWGISQVAIKHFEDQRIGLAPIEKSTRYVDYSRRVNGKFLYYADPTLRDLGLYEDYCKVMDGLFQTYVQLKPGLMESLEERFPTEKGVHVEKKALDTLRGLLPASTLSQVAFFGNGQAFEHLINRSAQHLLGEIRWAAKRAFEELYQVTPSFLRRLRDEERATMVEEFQKYLAEKEKRVDPFVQRIFGGQSDEEDVPEPAVKLVEWDPDGEAKVIAGILYAAPHNHHSWEETLEHVRSMSVEEQRAILDAYLAGRTERWQKVGRAFENAYVRFEIVANIGAWRDIHRHRMQTQQRQRFSCHHGYDVPAEVKEAGLEPPFRVAIDRAEELFARLERHDPDLAQYAVTLAHRIRFMQWTNLRQCFWEIELRTIPEGHPDYRRIEQEKFRRLEEVYPLIAERIMVNLGEYDFARRGQEVRVQEKLRKLEKWS